MHLTHPAKFRKSLPARCRYCDRQFFYRHGSRPRVFCSRSCQQRDFRHARHLDPKRDERCRKSEENSQAFKADFTDRPLVNERPKWVDCDLWHTIIAMEVSAFESATTDPEFANPYLAEIPADLSIPPFLQRREVRAAGDAR